MAKPKLKILIISSAILIAIIAFVFINSRRGRKVENLPITNNPVGAVKEVLELKKSEIFFYDLEKNEDLENFQTLGNWKSYSGSHSSKLDSLNEYSVTYKKKLGEIPDLKKVKQVLFSFKAFSDKPIEEATTVLSIERPDGKNILWLGNPIEIGKSKWSNVDYTFDIPDSALNSENTLKIYIWNKSKKLFYIDDLEITYYKLLNVAPQDENIIIEKNVTYDFETILPGQTDNTGFSTDEFHSKTHSFYFDSDKEYSPSIIRKVSEIADAELKLITLSVWIFPTSNTPEANLVVSIKDKTGKDFFYESTSTNSFKDQFKKGEWKKLRAQFKLPSEKISRDDFITVYIWNKSKNKFYADDLEIVYGEQHTRGGSEPTLNTSTLNVEGYDFKRNIPPFKTNYLTKIDIGNSDSENLVSSEKRTNTSFLPNDLLFVGNFLPSPEGNQQVLRINKSEIQLYSYCIDIKQFILVYYQKILQQLPISNIFSGDFDGDKKDEIIFVNELGKSYVIKIPTIQPCNNSLNKNPELLVTELITPKYLSDKVINSNIYSGDFNGDGKCDFIFVTKDSSKISFSQVDSKKNLLEIFDCGSLSKFTNGNRINSISAISFKPDLKSYIQISWKEYGKPLSEVLYYDKSTSSFLTYKNYKTSSIFGYHFTNYSGSYLNLSESEYLVYNRDWKFDLKLISTDKNGFYVVSNLDFKDFPLGRNPKYYECLRLIPGYFMKSNQMQLLVIMRNCDSENYKGVDCLKYSQDKSFPASIQLYTF